MIALFLAGTLCEYSFFMDNPLTLMIGLALRLVEAISVASN